MACMDYMDPNVLCPNKAIKLIHSLTHLQTTDSDALFKKENH